MRRKPKRAATPNGVSIPFIAGQWSLRGSKEKDDKNLTCLNPLHCGAVVASLGIPSSLECRKAEVSIPFIAGQWSLLFRHSRSRSRESVSIPFIAGQWSLREIGPRCGRGSPASQSPSLRGSGRFWRARIPSGSGPSRLNPLHCGAVVASTALRLPDVRFLVVSIPFIAGQWSLRTKSVLDDSLMILSQSPSLRGSGRFPTSPFLRLLVS